MDSLFVPSRLERSWRWLRWRGLALLLVFAAGLTAFLLGVEVSDRAGIAAAGLPTKVYYTLGLFVLGGLDLGVPSGGLPAAQNLLWFAYFAAPIITASALIEGIVRAINPVRWRISRMKGHVIIGGCGELTLIYLERLRELDPKRPVVVIESRTDTPRIQEARERYGALVVHADVTSDAVLEVMRVQHAHSAALLTGDDFANLEAASQLLRRAPELADRTVAHISDLRTLRLLERTSIDERLYLFNSHEIAAKHLVENIVLGHFRRTEPRDVVVLAGFGRFGQTVLDELQRTAEGGFETLVLVDVSASRQAATFDDQVGFASSYRRELIEGDLRDPRVWAKVDGHLNGGSVEPVIILATGEPANNVRAALELTRRYPAATVIARCFRESLFFETAASEGGFALVGEAELVRASIPKEWYRRGRVLRRKA